MGFLKKLSWPTKSKLKFFNTDLVDQPTFTLDSCFFESQEINQELSLRRECVSTSQQVPLQFIELEMGLTNYHTHTPLHKNEISKDAETENKSHF